MFGFHYLKDVVTLDYDREACNGCGTCLEVCPHAVLIKDKEGKKVELAARDDCMECGACAINCATGALRVQSGVGCASAVINAALGRTSSACCCSVEPGPDGKRVDCC